MEFGQDRYLLDDILNFVFGIFDIDDFDGDRLASRLVDTVTMSFRCSIKVLQVEKKTHPL